MGVMTTPNQDDWDAIPFYDPRHAQPDAEAEAAAQERESLPTKRIERWREIERLYAAGSLSLRGALKRHGLNPTLYNILSALAAQDSWGLRMADLASATHMSPPGATRAVDIAVDRGWVKREWVAEDNRGRLVTLLPAGWEARAAAKAAYEQAVETALT